jgi:large subunit ribosomal protein L28
MAYRCTICDKGPVSGKSYSHSHRSTKRVFRPNLQRQKLVIAGKTRTTYICSRCIKSGKAVRPSR